MSVLKFFICFGGTGAGKTVRVATRKSPLAMWQAEFIQSELERLWPGITVELQPMSTRGDKVCKTVKLGDFSQRFSFFIFIFCTGFFFRIVKNCLLLQPIHWLDFFQRNFVKIFEHKQVCWGNFFEGGSYLSPFFLNLILILILILQLFLIL